MLRQSVARVFPALRGGVTPRAKAKSDFLQHRWKNDLVIRILKHKTNFAHDGCAIKRGVYPVNEHSARVRRKKPVRQAQEGALPRAVVAQ